MTGYPKTGRYAKCRTPKQYWVSSVIAAGVACHAMELFRQLFNPQIYLLAYGRLYSNHGAMTPGADGETADRHVAGQDRARH